MRIAVRALTAFAGLFMLGLGVWALIDPRGFYAQVATFPPYNVHLLHDVGAFQAGIGATLILALFRRDALLVALLGASVGTALHALSHWIDRDLGGRTTDPWALSLLSLAVIAATAIHASQRRTAR